ncbi:S-adenosyl-L-methionine-dependent methyltransferase [Diplogelasinospora grovesii]|uniref:S-adenosyl-L-methionine-dependent methyltransferase n=1 Tax=Diplogelasinospora grovesii TaxID=303347 RepID=A0AAN6N3Z7_9PEZI|nr:S-adenosyl-L-methionine-dependent methyltransferase [Diplogelasinospora grovesii]
MASIERMTTLAKEISDKTTVITEYLTSKGLEAASYDVNGLAEFPIPPEDAIPFKARLELAAATRELYDISVGPKQGLRDLAWDSTNNLSLQAIWEFRVAEAVPLDGTISFEELTTKVEALNDGLQIGVLNLRRFLRHAMLNRIFCEPTKNQVAHTRRSRLLLEDEPLKNWAGFMCHDLWPPMANAVNAMKKWPGSEEPTETSFNYAYNQNLPWFDFIQQDQTFSKRYNLAMKAHGGAAGYSVEHVVEGYPWGELGDATVVDMGGNQGYISFAIAEAFPALKFIVQDTVGMRTQETMGTVPPHLADRVKLTTHDFFTPQTEAAKCYFFRMIFHGFANKYCVKILQALIPALRKGSRIVINDGALPEPGTVGYIEERAMRTLDLFMQVTVNAHEREADDWAALFAKADPRYKVNRIWKPERSVMSFIEAEWMGE